MLDIFNDDAFSDVSLTESINMQPANEGRLARHFSFKGIRTETALIEEKHGSLQLINSAARGSQPKLKGGKKRRMRSFTVPHLPHDAQILAKDIQGVRQFGAEGQLESMTQEIDERMEDLRADHEATWEYHRAGAIQGVVYDADGSVIHNYFTEFGITETVIAMDTSVAGDLRAKAAQITRELDDALGATPYNGVTVYMGDQAWDLFIADSEVTDAYQRWRDGAHLRSDPRAAFSLWGINWQEYRYSLGTKYYIPRDVGRVVVEGPKIFQHIAAPADTMAAVNTKGKKIYVMKEAMPLDKGMYLHSQSNPLFIPTRPAALLKVTIV